MRDERENRSPTWQRFAEGHRRLTPPLSPSAGDVETARRAIAEAGPRVVLFGMTPALAGLGEDLTAFDHSQHVIETVWPGDGPTRRAVLADWLSLGEGVGLFDAAIGDGALNSVGAALPEMMGVVARLLRPGGVAALRVFAAPEEPETSDDIRRDVFAGWTGNLHALRWRLGMALAAGRPGFVLPVREIVAAFDALFPDRQTLAAATGWPRSEIDAVDLTRDADYALAFPPVSTFTDLARRHFSEVRVVEASGYPLASRCPTLLLRR
jgi:SAM-dependent methyltransferase